MPSPGPNLRGALLALAGYAVYASHDAVIKALGASYSTVQIVFFATVLGMPLGVLALMRDRTPGTLVPRNPGWVAARSAGVVVSGLSAFYAFTQLPFAQAYALFFAAPLIVTLLAVPVLGERVGRWRLLALFGGFCGVLIVLRPGFAAVGVGQAAALLAAAASALASIAARRVGRDERPAVMVFYPMMGNFAATGAALPFVYVPVAPFDLALMGYVAACSWGALLLVVLAYRAAEAVVVAPMQYSQILWAVLFGALFFDELPDLLTIIGAAAVIGSGVAILLREGRAQVSATQPALGADVRPGGPSGAAPAS